MMTVLKNKRMLSVLIVTIYMLVFMATIYLFIFPANSNSSDNYMICGLDEHMHTDECYAPYDDDYSGRILVCSVTDANDRISHIHDSFCYDDTENLICPVEEYTHTHDELCFNVNNEQICGYIVHQHDEQCFGSPENKENCRVLACGQPAHVHRDECYDLGSQEDTAQAEDMQTEDYAVSLLNEIPQEHAESAPEYQAETYSFDTTNAIDLGETEGSSYKYIKEISVSYQSSDDWITINNGNNISLPANADYRLEVGYKELQISDLIAHDGKIKLDNIPNWLNISDGGEILVDSIPAASMKVQDSVLLITFDSGFMEQNSEKKLVNGSFFVRGSVDWRKLDENGTGSIHMPTIDMTIHFENDLPKKYGKASVKKEDPELVYDSSKNPYLKYTVTVNSLESDYSIPDVRVVDSFTNKGEFIQGYCGINVTENIPDNFKPVETSDKNGSPGTLEIIPESRHMQWNIGNLLPGEKRTLTYYAKLNPYYIGSSGRGNIVNNAELFSDDISKGSDTGGFTPIVEANINKQLLSAGVDEFGTGTASYQITISAPETNSYDLNNLRIHDYVDSKYSEFVVYPASVTAQSDMTTGTVDYTTDRTDNTSFNATIPVLRPGETITVTYTVDLKNIYLSGTGDIDFLNTAELFSENNSSRGEASNHHFGSSNFTHTFGQNKWVRKLDGGNISNDTVINADSGRAYKYDDTNISSTELPGSFTVPAGSRKYQVVLNEEGRWDLSSAIMKDNFDSTDIIYKGWLCIQAYENGINSDNFTDVQVVNEVGKNVSSETVWLNIDGRNEFLFKPSDLGLSDKYTYLMTYYSGIQNAADVGEIMITNNFAVSGNIGVDGNTISLLNGVFVKVSSYMHGDLHYNLHKDSWYYSEHPDEEENVKIFNKNDYSNGAIYWVIRVDGNIKAEFRVKDVMTEQGVSADSLAGIYKGSKSLDFTNRYPTFSKMLKDVGEGKTLTKLSGNELNFGMVYNDWWNYNGNNIGMVYDQLDVTDLSQLDGKSLVIANTYNSFAVVTNETTTDGYDGLIGNKNIRYLNGNKGKAVTSTLENSDTLTQWTFKMVDGNRFYIYSYVDGAKKYMTISGGSSGGGDVSLSDTPETLNISLNGGKIIIANENGMALNWYGGNGVDKKFSGYETENGVNDKQTVFEVKDDFKWCTKGSGDNDIGICFQRDIDLADDEALYIVVRTIPNAKPANISQSNSILYKNGVESKQNSTSGNWVPANTAEHILKLATPVYKQGMCSYIFNGKDWTGTINRLGYWKRKDLITEPGTYVEWLININLDGSMQGKADVSDILPKGVTPVYLYPYWISNKIKGTTSFPIILLQFCH